MSTSFIACPANVFQSPVSPTAYKVFLVLKSFDGKDHKIFPSKKTLAQRCGLGLTSIYQAIKQLAKAGLILVCGAERGGFPCAVLRGTESV